MKDLLEKASPTRLLIIDVDGLLGGSLEPLSRARGTIDSSNDGHG